MRPTHLAFIPALLLSLLFAACGNVPTDGQNNETAVDEAVEETVASNSPKTAERLAGYLRKQFDPGELESIPEASRQFRFESIDLNGDGVEEHLAELEGAYHCGSGGCTYLLISDDGELLSRFTVSRAPFVVFPVKDQAWPDLLVYSGGKMRRLIHNGQTYPSNPSVQPVFEGEPDVEAIRLLEEGTEDVTFAF